VVKSCKAQWTQVHGAARLHCAIRRREAPSTPFWFESMLRGLGARSRTASRLAVFSGPSWTRTRSQWIKNPSKASQYVTNGAKTAGERYPIVTDQTAETVSKPLHAFSRSTLIAALYAHASALAKAGDIEAARVAHEAAGRLLAVPKATNAVVDLNQRRKP
jgi:hypothetical protein